MSLPLPFKIMMAKATVLNPSAIDTEITLVIKGKSGGLQKVSGILKDVTEEHVVLHTVSYDLGGLEELEIYENKFPFTEISSIMSKQGSASFADNNE